MKKVKGIINKTLDEIEREIPELAECCNLRCKALATAIIMFDEENLPDHYDSGEALFCGEHYQDMLYLIQLRDPDRNFDEDFDEDLSK